MKDAFVIYGSYSEQLALLTDEQAGALFKAIVAYHNGADVPQLDGVCAMAFSFIRAQMDRDSEKYSETCKKRAEAGARGGRPKKEEAADEEAESSPEDEKANGFSEKAKKANGFSEKAKKANGFFKKHNEYEYEYDLKEKNNKKRKPGRQNAFNNFRERTYDYQKLEAALLQCAKGDIAS